MLKKHIMVTGGAGFIGSHLCESLLAEGHNVICIDNYYTGTKANIASLLNNERFKFIKHDVTTPLDIKVDEIYNLACPASPVHYQIDPVRTLKTNILGMINVLELALKNNAKVLQASTSEVYGDPIIHPQVESYWGNVNPIGIRSCYDEGKRCAETLCMDYARKYDIDIKIIRIFNTYGPKMNINDGRVVSNFIVEALREENISIYGDGSQTRSFCYIDDLITGMVKMINTEMGFNGPVNLGNPKEFNILELAKKVIQLTGSKSNITFKPLPIDDPKRRKPDITLAKAKLNWQPQIELEEGLIKTIAYFTEVLV